MKLEKFARLLPLAALAAVAACDTGPAEIRQIADGIAVIVNSVDRSLTTVSVLGTDAPVRTIGLGAQGTPTTVAADSIFAVVPMGSYPFAQVVNLQTNQVVHTVALPANSGATGVAFANDSIAIVANSNLNTVTPVNVFRGTAGAQIAVGDYPQAVFTYADRVYVLNGNLDANFQPAGNGTVTVLNATTLAVVTTVQLGGRNPIDAAARGTSVFVLNAGDFGQTNGSLSVIGTQTLQEEAHHPGFGSFPSSVAYSPGTQELFVTVFGSGLISWDPATLSFIDAPANPLRPGNNPPPYASVAFDPFINRMHVVRPGNCIAPGTHHRLSSRTNIERTVDTGVCPLGIAFARIPLD